VKTAGQSISKARRSSASQELTALPSRASALRILLATVCRATPISEPAAVQLPDVARYARSVSRRIAPFSPVPSGSS
jgi:hypothetical protein